MELRIEGNMVEVKYNFASLKAWGKYFAPNLKKDSANDHTELFDIIFTGLAGHDPEVLMQVIHGGLAYLDKKPNDEELFEAVSELLAEKSVDELSTEVLTEVVANGFFKSMMNQWSEQFSRYVEAAEKGLKKRLPSEATDDQKKNFEDMKQQYQELKEASQDVLDKLKATLNPTETV